MFNIVQLPCSCAVELMLMGNSHYHGACIAVGKATMINPSLHRRRTHRGNGKIAPVLLAVPGQTYPFAPVLFGPSLWPTILSSLALQCIALVPGTRGAVHYFFSAPCSCTYRRCSGGQYTAVHTADHHSACQSSAAAAAAAGVAWMRGRK